jgi:hypothetical protein
MFPLDALAFDIILPSTARPTADDVKAGLGAEAAAARMMIDVDLDYPQLEAEIAPTFILRKRGDRRVYVVDDATAPLRENPRTQYIVARDLRPEKDRLVKLVDKLGGRLGRMSAFGTWGDAVVVARTARDLRAVSLLGWALDPVVDADGRRRAQQLTQREFELKLKSYDKRLDELQDAAILARIPPATLERHGDFLVMHVLSDRDGSWDIRKSYELEKRVAATDQFSRIPGARQALVTPEEEAPARAAAPAPAAPPEPPRPVGPPIRSVEIDGRVVLVVPPERWDSDTITALGKRPLDALTSRDAVPGKQRDAIHQHGGGFVAPLAFLSEVFLDGKPLDKRRFEAEAAAAGPDVRALEGLLPRYGTVRVLERAGKRFVTSELGGDPARLLDEITRTS